MAWTTPVCVCVCARMCVCVCVYVCVHSDTHYLLYIYDRLKQDLSNTPLSTVVPNLLVPIPTHQQLPETPLSITLERSRRLCLTLYEKETLKETAAMDLTVRWVSHTHTHTDEHVSCCLTDGREPGV